MLCQLGQPVGKHLAVGDRGNQRRPSTGCRIECMGKACRDVGEADACGGGGDTCCRPVQHLRQSGGIGGREQEDLFCPVATEGFLMAVEIAALILFEHCVEVGPAKAKGADTRAARRVTAQPGPRLGLHVERALREIGRRVRDGHVQRRGLHLVMQRQRHLDQPGAARRRLGVADHRLDRSHAAELHIRTAVGKDLRQRFDLCLVAYDGTGAMRLDHAHGGR